MKEREYQERKTSKQQRRLIKVLRRIKMKKEVQANVPFQVQHLIDSMLNTKDNVYLRGNFRARLDYVREQINSAISKYDKEVMLANTTGKKKTG